MIALLFISLFIAASQSLAAPSIRIPKCDISQAKINFPAGQTALPPPTATPSYISIGIGVQNYTCTDEGTYTSAGAVADLFDISCLVGTPVFNQMPDTVFALWKAAPKFASITQIINLLHYAKTPLILGQHYFITNPITGSGLSPKWDFTSQGATKGNPNAFVVAARLANLAAPTGSKDVDWLALNKVQGDLADQIYRVDTKGGQLPASCTPGSAPISVKYTSNYWLFGSSVHQ